MPTNRVPAAGRTTNTTRITATGRASNTTRITATGRASNTTRIAATGRAPATAPASFGRGVGCATARVVVGRRAAAAPFPHRGRWAGGEVCDDAADQAGRVVRAGAVVAGGVQAEALGDLAVLVGR
ncbi:hypothetical protein [Paractinoplanes rishiriensis]|uniref:hypothetical protein n=1 Tax=Paractinoplanes rishiriensis TaxID=1050105 RepID=UPI0019429055|nr:hypothetical protein [Actinoplanes rishiriensis]